MKKVHLYWHVTHSYRHRLYTVLFPCDATDTHLPRRQPPGPLNPNKMQETIKTHTKLFFSILFGLYFTSFSQLKSNALIHFFKKNQKKTKKKHIKKERKKERKNERKKKRKKEGEKVWRKKYSPTEKEMDLQWASGVGYCVGNCSIEGRAHWAVARWFLKENIVYILF